VSEGKETQFFQHAVQLVQQVTLTGKYATTGQVFQLLPYPATLFEGLKLSNCPVTFQQLIEPRKQRFLMMVPKTPGEIRNRPARLLLGWLRPEPFIARQVLSQSLQTGFESKARIRRPISAADFVIEHAQVPLIDPAIAGPDTLGDKGFKFLGQRVAGFAQLKLVGISVTPFEQTRCYL
jgi:hypothetical protein